MPLPDFDSIDRGLERLQQGSQAVADIVQHVKDGADGAATMTGRRKNLVQRARGAHKWLGSALKAVDVVESFLRKKPTRR